MLSVPEMGLALTVLVGCYAVTYRVTLAFREEVVRSIGPTWTTAAFLLSGLLFFQVVIGVWGSTLNLWNAWRGKEEDGPECRD